MLKDKRFIKFLVIFFSVFSALYYGTLFLVGLAVPGGNYSPFIDKYFDIASYLRTTLMHSSKQLLTLFGTETFRTDEYVLRAASGKGIRLVYSCLGFGVMNFWIAYTIAMSGKLKFRLLWLAGGLLLIFIINVTRISLVLKAANSGWQFPFGWDHHTWFNIVSYIFILLLIFWHHRVSTKITNE